MSQTYSDVDSSPDPGRAVDWQAEMARWPAVAAYKKHTLELVAHAARVLDVGCGPGVDLTSHRDRFSVGVDRSAAMCAATTAAGSSVVCGDAHDLPFRHGTFDAVRADRVFQHLAHPVAALREAIRVLASGGRLVIADPDQETLLIEVPGVRQDTLDRLKQLRRDIGYRNGRLASRLPAMFTRSGLAGVAVDAFVIALDDPALAFGLPGWPAHWRVEGGFTDEEFDEWNAAISAPRPGFLYAVTVLVVSGTKP